MAICCFIAKIVFLGYMWFRRRRVTNCAIFYLNQVTGFDSVTVEFLAFLLETGVTGC